MIQATDTSLEIRGGGMKGLVVPICSHVVAGLSLDVLERNGRPEWTRTIDLLRVREAL